MFQFFRRRRRDFILDSTEENVLHINSFAMGAESSERDRSAKPRRGSVPGRAYIDRDRKEGHEKLMCDYFSPTPTYPERRKMSAYENVVGGKLKLKGKALDVKAGGMKKKKKHNKRNDQNSGISESELSAGGSAGQSNDNDNAKQLSEEGNTAHYDSHLTPAERRYIEQREQIDNHRLAKIANKSHRDRIQDFNQYLANMSEHYDIPKVGPG